MAEEQLTYYGKTTLTEVPKLLEKVKLMFVKALRVCFASSFSHKDLKYNEKEDITKIKIYTAFPLKLEFIPCVIISITSGDFSFNYLQDDYTDFIKNLEQFTFNGKLEFTVNLTILSNGTLEREKIIDHLIFFVRHLFLGLFRSYGLNYWKNMSLSGENIVDVNGRAIYSQTLSIPCYMEYNASVDLKELETIREILINSINLELQEE